MFRIFLWRLTHSRLSEIRVRGSGVLAYVSNRYLRIPVAVNLFPPERDKGKGVRG